MEIISQCDVEKQCTHIVFFRRIRDVQRIVRNEKLNKISCLFFRYEIDYVSSE